jgi:hypothetical protein
MGSESGFLHEVMNGPINNTLVDFRALRQSNLLIPKLALLPDMNIG